MYFNKKDYSLYYEKYGEGEENIIILPGWGDTRNTFTSIINHLKSNYTIYIIDYPGFGNSMFPNHDLTIYDYASTVKDFIKKLNIKKATIIAHSFGGRIAALLTGYYKENINKLILIDIAGIKQKRNIFKYIKIYTYKLLKKLVRILPKRKRSFYIKRLFNFFASSDYQELDSNMYQTFKNIINEDLKPIFKNINTDTMLIWGENDKATPIKDGKYINKKIKNSKLIIFPNTGHFPYIDYPKLTNDLIDNFLKK